MATAESHLRQGLRIRENRGAGCSSSSWVLGYVSTRLRVCTSVNGRRRQVDTERVGKTVEGAVAKVIPWRIRVFIEGNGLRCTLHEQLRCPDVSYQL